MGTRPLKGFVLPKVALGRLRSIGREGGQARIYEPERFSGLLYKEYRRPDQVDGSGLRRLRDVRLQMAMEDRDALDTHAAWPAVAVEDNGRSVGFLMAPAARRFFHDFGRAGSKPVDLQYLMHPPKAVWGSLELPDTEQRVALCRHAAGMIHLLHQAGCVVGDISMSNILWTLTPEPSVYLIDCDGVRVAGRKPVLPQSNTPHWRDPSDARQTFATDRYKLALLVVRVLSMHAYWEPGINTGPLLQKAPTGMRRDIDALVQTIDRSGGSRPTAEAWLGVLA